MEPTGHQGEHVKVWVYYNPTTGEAAIYDTEPPAMFGRRQFDIGPIALDEELILRYAAAKDSWHEAHAEFMRAVQLARSPDQPEALSPDLD